MTRIAVHRSDEFSRENLERIYAVIDRMHDAAMEGHAEEMTNWTAEELVQWLTEISFTADETIREIQMAQAPLRAVLEASVYE